MLLIIAVFLFTDTNTPSLQLWNLTGDQGNQWTLGKVDVGLQGDFFLVMEAEMKEGFQGDIAIDDISFVNCDIGKKTII